MSACSRFCLNLFRSKKKKNGPETQFHGNSDPKGPEPNAVDSVNPPYCGVYATNEGNQNAAFPNYPAPINSQPIPRNTRLPDNHDHVGMTYIALPGPEFNYPKNTGSCPPQDVTQEIEGLETTSTITENSDSEWVDRRNKDVLRHSGSDTSLSEPKE